MYTDSGHYQHGSVNSISGSRNVGWLHNLSIALTATDYSGKAQCHRREKEQGIVST